MGRRGGERLYPLPDKHLPQGKHRIGPGGQMQGREQQNHRGRGGNIAVIEIQHIGNIEEMEGRQAKEGTEQPAVPGAGGAEQQEEQRRKQVALVHFRGEEVHRQHDDAGHGKKSPFSSTLPVKYPGENHREHCCPKGQQRRHPQRNRRNVVPVQTQKPIEVIGVDREVIVIGHSQQVSSRQPTEIPALCVG